MKRSFPPDSGKQENDQARLITISLRNPCHADWFSLPFVVNNSVEFESGAKTDKEGNKRPFLLQRFHSFPFVFHGDPRNVPRGIQSSHLLSQDFECVRWKPPLRRPLTSMSYVPVNVIGFSSLPRRKSEWNCEFLRIVLAAGRAEIQTPVSSCNSSTTRGRLVRTYP